MDFTEPSAIVAERAGVNLPIVVLPDLVFSPLLAMARDHILGFVQLDEIMIGRAVEGCWRAIAR
jgi:hypothetical protein